MAEELGRGGTLNRSLLLLMMGVALFADEPVKVLVVTGGHDHPVSFYSLFDDSRLAVTVEPHPGAFTDDIRKRAEVLVLYDMVPEMEERKRENLKAFVE